MDENQKKLIKENFPPHLKIGQDIVMGYTILITLLQSKSANNILEKIFKSASIFLYRSSLRYNISKLTDYFSNIRTIGGFVLLLFNAKFFITTVLDLAYAGQSKSSKLISLHWPKYGGLVLTNYSIKFNLIVDIPSYNKQLHCIAQYETENTAASNKIHVIDEANEFDIDMNCDWSDTSIYFNKIRDAVFDELLMTIDGILKEFANTLGKKVNFDEDV